MLYSATQPGYVTAIPMPNDVPLPLAITGWGGAAALASVVTEVGVGREVGFQAQPTLDSRSFLTIFGERPGRVRVAGLSFAGGCGQASASGLEEVLKFYDAYNAAAYGAPLVVAVGTSASGVFQGFLVKMSGDLNRTELRMAQFGLEFLVLPRK